MSTIGKLLVTQHITCLHSFDNCSCRAGQRPMCLLAQVLPATCHTGLSCSFHTV